jgi:PAS domain S-box-containing protein
MDQSSGNSAGPGSGKSDVASLKQVEARLRRMTRVFMDGADPILIRDLDGRVIDANYEVERVFGWTREELLGQRTKHLLPPEWHALADRTLQECQRGETLRNVEAEVRTKSGSVVPVLVTAFLLTEDEDEPVAIANIVKDIRRLKRTSQQLEQRNRELKQFCNILAHDLSAPLRSINSFAEQLAADYQGRLDEQADEHLRYILQSTSRMQQLIEDLLRYARLDNQEPSLQPVECDRVLQQALSNLRASIAKSQAEISWDPLPTVVGHESQLMQLLQNLIGNAIKFRRDEPPRIHVGCEVTEQDWHFSVRDNGIGIAAEYQDRVFDAFRRLHADEVYPGSGLGLAICKTIVQRHGGQIWVESERGQGSTFHFTISRHPEAEAD